MKKFFTPTHPLPVRDHLWPSSVQTLSADPCAEPKAASLVERRPGHLVAASTHRPPTAFRIQPSQHDGFTLMELLVVVLIIGILASASIGIYQHSRTAAWKQRARDSARQIAVAWNIKLLDDHAFPPSISFSDINGTALPLITTDITFPTTTTNMAILNSTKLYLEQNANQRSINSGMIDKWGHFFNVRLDLNYDGLVQDPRDPSGATTINANVVVWSLGPYSQTETFCVASP